MPLSGSVTAGSAALASQYNNLRSDVLSTTQGHTHTGASENGAKVHGTALDTTGATNGQVLTADGSGGATFAAAAGAGQLSTLTLSGAYSTAASATALRYALSDTTSIPRHCITDGGTVIIAITDTAFDTGTHAFQSYNLGATAIVGSSAVVQITAGTTGYSLPIGYGYSSGTAFVVREAVRTSGGTNSFVLRKFNNALTSNMWNATLLSGFVNASVDPSDLSKGPGAGQRARNFKYESSVGIWYGGDYREAGWGTGDASLRVAKVWVVNDASGSVYSAAFGSADASSGPAYTNSVAYVPGVGTALGTVHAWGRVNGTVTYCKYTVGSASITADSTAVGAAAAIWGVIDPEEVSQAFWISSATALAVSCDQRFFFLDRSAGTILATTPNMPDDYIGSSSTNGNDGHLHFPSGWSTMYQSTVSRMGIHANSTYYNGGTTLYYSAGNVISGGAGSATHFIAASPGGRISTFPFCGEATLTIGSASTGRLINLEPVAHFVTAISASDGYWTANPGTVMSYGIRRDLYPSLVLPAGATAVIRVRNTISYDALTGIDFPPTLGTAFVAGTVTAAWMTAVATATMTARVITLA